MLSIQGDDIIVAAEKDLLTTLFSVDLVETKLMTGPIDYWDKFQHLMYSLFCCLAVSYKTSFHQQQLWVSLFVQLQKINVFSKFCAVYNIDVTIVWHY